MNRSPDHTEQDFLLRSRHCDRALVIEPSQQITTKLGCANESRRNLRTDAQQIPSRLPSGVPNMPRRRCSGEASIRGMFDHEHNHGRPAVR